MTTPMRTTPIAVPASTVKAIQRNVEAHTTYLRYYDLFYGEQDVINLGVSQSRWTAAQLITRAAHCFEIEFRSMIRSRKSENKALREALAILNKAAAELDVELSGTLKKYFGEAKVA